MAVTEEIRAWRAKEAARVKAYYEAHCEEVKARHKIYRATNREKIAARGRVYYEAHREEVKARHKAYRETHRDERAAYDKAYRVAHRGKIRAYREAHREEEMARVKAWCEANPEQITIYSARHRARKANARGATYTTAEMIKARWEFYGNLCYLCGKPAEATDHVIPLARGGSHWPANLRPICTSCNSTKGTRSLGEISAVEADTIRHFEPQQRHRAHRRET